MSILNEEREGGEGIIMIDGDTRGNNNRRGGFTG
jgi:hypothetical protein